MSSSTPHTTELEIRLFGNLQVRCNRRSVRMRTGSAKQSLLAYLLLHRDTQLARAKVAHDIWPDERRPLRKLRDAKDRLARSQFGKNCIIADETTIQWRSPNSYYLDVESFEAALLNARTALEHGNWGGLQRALALANECYQDELLVSLEGEWLEEIRSGLFRRYRTLLEESVAAYRREENLHAAVHVAEALIDLDRLHEESYQVLMHIYAEQGLVSAVVDTYRLLEERLRRELSVPPNAQSLDLYRELTSGRRATLVHGTHETRTPSPSIPIGRESEWVTLNERWHRVQAGRNQCAVVQGEAGIGKTHLTDAFTAHLATGGVEVFHARCYDSDELNIFSPIYAWMRDPRVVQFVSQLPPPTQTELARFNTDLLVTNPMLPMPQPIALPYQKRLLYDSMASAIALIDAPVVLYVDDMQWLDSETAAWLRFMLQQPAGGSPLLVLGAICQDEFTAIDDAHAWIQTLRRERNVTWLNLPRLNQQQTAALIQSVDQRVRTYAELLDVFEKTEGNPFFALAYLHAESEGSDNRPRIPLTIQQTVADRLRSLSAKSVRLVEFAAVLGRDFDYTLLMRGVNANERDVVRGLDELTTRHVLRDLGQNIYAFSHGIIRDVVYDSLHTARRRLLHRRAAAAYQRRNGCHLNAAIIGGHFENAQLWDEAVHAFMRAGDTELQLAAFDTAQKHYAIARRLTRRLPTGDGSLRIEATLLLRLGVLESVARPLTQSSAVRYFENAYDLARATGKRDLTFAAVRGLWECAHHSNRLAEAADLATDLTQTAQGTKDPIDLAEAHWTVGATAFYQGQYRRSIAVLEECLTLLDSDEKKRPTSFFYLFDTKIAVRCYLAIQYLFIGDIRRSRGTIRFLDDHAAAITNPADLIYYRTHRLIYAYLCRDLRYGTLHAKAAIEAAEDTGIPIAILGCKMLRLWFASETGQPLEDMQELETFLLEPKNCASIGSTHFFAILAQANTRCGDFDRAETVLDAGMQNVAAYGDEFMLPILLHERARWLRHSGAPLVNIHTAYRCSLEVARNQEAHYLALRIALDYVEWLAQIGRREDAVDLLTPLIQEIENAPDNPYVGQALRFLDSAS